MYLSRRAPGSQQIKGTKTTAKQNRAKAENSAQNTNQNHSFSHTNTPETFPSFQFVNRWIDSKILLEVSIT